MSNQEEGGLTSKLRSFDFYKKLPQDIAEPTMSGALGTPPSPSLHRQLSHNAAAVRLGAK